MLFSVIISEATTCKLIYKTDFNCNTLSSWV